jgi:TPR repeat protein
MPPTKQTSLGFDSAKCTGRAIRAAIPRPADCDSVGWYTERETAMQVDAMRPLWIALLATAALTAGGAVQAQTAPAPDDQDGVTVTGQRMPGAEAPRSATCEALARDPLFRAQLAAGGGEPLMGPRAFLPTRPTRSPDYSAPPKVPVGSALPILPKARFGRGRANTELVGVDPRGVSGTLAPEGSVGGFADDNSVDTAIQSCRLAFSAGGSAGSTLPSGSSIERPPFDRREDGLTTLNSTAANGRAMIAAMDTTLPMAFALFDQGRYAESLDWFKKASNKLPYRDGGDEAALFVGKLYLQGLGDKSDPVEAVKWLKKAATAPFNPTIEMPMFDPRQPERNTAVGEAAVILANVYRSGFRGIAKDEAEAIKWYARASAVGHVPAAKLLGDLYYNGTGTARDVKKAAAQYRQAARLGLPAAQFALAEILYNGEDGVRQDRKEALGWYQAAAKLDHPGALYALGRAYDLGEGVKPDPQLAMGFYKTAAQHGSAAAMTSIGTYFYEGRLVPKDDRAARRWFVEATAGRDPDGMFNLAAMMTKGEGGPRDVAMAWVWLKRAATLGHGTAPRAVAVLEARMTEAEKQAAAAAAR